MAHIAKYKAPSVGHMLAHYRRDRSSLERDNIDPERIKNDLVVGHYTNKDGKLVVGRVEPREGEPNWGTVESRIERVNEAQKAAGKRATRKDAVVMADVVVTLPDNVHMDESTPHAHFGFTPIKDGTLSWKNYFDGRDALRGWQDRFFEKVSKPWGLERGEKDTGRTHKDAAQMRRDAEREIKELDKRKECLRQEVEEMEAATPSLSEGVRTLWKARSDGSREEELGSAIEGLRGRISGLSSQIADCNGRAEGIERGLPALRARYRELAERFNDTRSRVEQALGRLREVPNTLSELAQDIARKLGKPLFDPDSLDYQTREVTRVAKALDRDRPHVPQQRGREAR